MKNKLLIGLLILYSTHVSSQDWSLLRSDRVQRYTGLGFTFNINYQFGESFTLKYDSVRAVSGDSVFHCYRMISYLDTSLCVPSSALFPFNPTSIKQLAWIGPDAIKKSDGKHEFINRSNETIYFNPYLTLNQTDTLIWLNNSNYIIYTLDSLVGVPLGSGTDSIKVFSLLMKDSLNQNIAHPVNQKKIRVSKLRGGITLPKFFDFPSDLEFVQWQADNSLRIGVYQLSPEEVFDYQPGDVFHYRQGVNIGFPQIITYQIDSIKQRINTPGSVQYLISRNTASTNFSGVIANTNRIDSLWLNYSNLQPTGISLGSKEVLLMGNTAQIGGGPSLNWVNPFTIPLDPSRLVVGYSEIFFNDTAAYSSFPCLYDYLDNSPTRYYYAKGFGFILSSRFNSNNSESYHALVYSKKGAINFGTPHPANIFLSTQELILEKPTVSLFPNPNNGKFTLQALPGQLRIMDLYGKEILNVNHEAESAQYIFQTLAKGVYIYRYTSASGNHSIGKLKID